MGLLVDGAWQEDSTGKEFGSRTTDGHFVRPATAFRNFVTADGSAGPTGEGGFPAEARPLSSLCLARLPVGAPHADLPQAQKARDVISVSITEPLYGKTGWEFGTEPRRARSTPSTASPRSPKSICSPIRIIPAASRCRCCGTRSGAPSSTTNSSEIIRMLNSAFDAFTDDPHRLLSRRRCAPRSTRSTTSSIRRQQRRLSRRLCHDARHAYEEAARGVFATLDEIEDRLSRPALSGRPSTHRSRLAAVHDARPLRRGLLQPLQMQSAADRRLSQSVELSARSLSGAGHRRDRQHRSHQAALLRQPAPVNPTGIVPIGPLIDFTAPHDRGRFG